MEQEKFLTLDEVAELLKVDKRTIMKEIHAGKLKTFKIGRQYRIADREIQRFSGEKT
jgi:excisionase family DNA binding protein